ncbi:MAG TPA: hypothetical protein PKE04_06535 [Clostridia bacterium]|nr:hypothetical protein [Clostridia bacterium]
MTFRKDRSINVYSVKMNPLNPSLYAHFLLYYTVQNANRILVLKDGALVGSGTHGRLIESCPLYRDMVAANDRRDRWTIRKGATVA